MSKGRKHPSRRTFVKKTAATLTALPVTSMAWSFPVDFEKYPQTNPAMFDKTSTSLIGQYGPWAASLMPDPPRLSFRLSHQKDIHTWKEKARSKVEEFLGAPDVKNIPKAQIEKKYSYDGLDIEELSWQLPYGRPTKAILLKPSGATQPLPGILGLHDHGGNKYFARRKITQTGADQHPLMREHQTQYYEGRAWANEIAKRGYVVLVPDNFTFGSRRVWYQDVSGFGHGPLKTENRSDDEPEKPKNIQMYNEWAGHHEHIMAKSLFSAGMTWPGVFLREDQQALDVLCERSEVDENKVGCAGLSGGGLRTAYLGGLDERIQCAVCVGFMSTWKDFLLHKSFTHTWMTYIPMIPRYLDFPEILGIRCPLPTMVLNNNQDQLFTLSEMKRADEIMQEVFDKAGAGDRYRCNFYEGEHKFDQEMQLDAFAWFDKWLS